MDINDMFDVAASVGGGRRPAPAHWRPRRAVAGAGRSAEATAHIETRSAAWMAA
ncbi:hypothetical protein [Micromonospora sp. CPCC 206061]|uniref:hypothetical protein n=1 Tax=Micromonospora sp. CPCC 206061 TaxID=3122410 RepID=UPI002FEF4510